MIAHLTARDVYRRFIEFRDWSAPTDHQDGDQPSDAFRYGDALYTFGIYVGGLGSSPAVTASEFRQRAGTLLRSLRASEFLMIRSRPRSDLLARSQGAFDCYYVTRLT